MQSTEELSCPGFESVRGARPRGGTAAGAGRLASCCNVPAEHIFPAEHALSPLQVFTVHVSSGGGGLYTNKWREEGGSKPSAAGNTRGGGSGGKVWPRRLERCVKVQLGRVVWMGGMCQRDRSAQAG